MKSARLGVVGEHPAGMDSCNLDEPQLKKVFGLQIARIDLTEVFTRARSISGISLEKTRAALDSQLDNLAELDQVPLQGTLSVYNALKEIASDQKLDGLAVRCWPEFFTEMGCAACGAMSMLSDGFGKCVPLPTSCEADINGTVTQLMLQWLSGTPAFGTDMVGIDVEKDRIALWHCGLAPLSMADPNVQPHGTNHSNRNVPLVFDFPLKAGTVTVARTQPDRRFIKVGTGQGRDAGRTETFQWNGGHA